MEASPGAKGQGMAERLKEWRQQQAEVEQRLLTLDQQQRALQFQIEVVRQLRHELWWYRQELIRIRQERRRGSVMTKQVPV
jgi:hypothetical protein